MDLQVIMQQMMQDLNGYGYRYAMQAGQQPYDQYPQNSVFDQAPGPEEQDDEDDEDDDEQRTLFCGNLDQRVTEEILYEVFVQAGPIEGVRIPSDNTGRQRNFGFVIYQRISAVPFALELYQGLELFQKKVTIKQQGADKVKPPSFGQNRLHNPFIHELPGHLPNDSGAPRHGRHSLHGARPYDRSSGANNKYNNGDLRRRSDSSVMDRNRPRAHPYPQHHHQHDRRSDQRNNNKRRLL
ncbi:GL13956 [Drosophila persimilis]|uniref:GL13956 n=1 Tax=Drosophila persimilis TaxID=7234 RepID=B4GQR5_DROPE|nr:31 kDa ribonucleoprotein, chloroplastic [Drosophila persimilis]EDW39937.1 GL13956 [Drosophila persimilis]